MTEKVFYYAVRKAQSWDRFRVVKYSKMQAFPFSRRGPFVFDTKAQAEAVCKKENKKIGVIDESRE